MMTDDGPNNGHYSRFEFCPQFTRVNVDVKESQNAN